MAKLILKKFRCIDDTSESFPDSPYFAVFVGNPTTKATEVHLVRREAWDNEISAGDSRSPNLTVDSSVSSGEIVLAALLEEDHDADVTGTRMTMVRNWMAAVFPAFAANGVSPSVLAGRMTDEFRRALNTMAISNDEILGIKQVNVTPGEKVVTYTGDGGKYDVTFSVA